MAHTRLGPVATALLGLTFIVVGTAVKTGYLVVRRGPQAGPSGIVVRTGAGDVEMPLPSRDSVSGLSGEKAPPTPPELATDTLFAPAAANDTNGVRPSADELTSLSSEMIVPVVGVKPKDLLDTFNEARGTRRHNALDIPAPKGTPVVSATAGRILHLYTSQAGGLMVYASDASDRFVLMYAHLDHYASGLADGMPLQRGDTLGFVGTTGNAPPNVPHLHFGITRSTNVARWWTGMPVDPRPLLRR